MQPSRLVFLKKFFRIALAKTNNACEQFETNTNPPTAAGYAAGPTSFALIHAGLEGFNFFSGSSLAEDAAMLS
jgi:hypothetical protein